MSQVSEIATAPTGRTLGSASSVSRIQGISSAVDRTSTTWTCRARCTWPSSEARTATR